MRHPWGDYGRLVSTTVSGMGSTILSIPIDSAGSPTPVINSAQYRDADAIGNPVAMLTQVLNGGWPTDIPGTFPVPTPQEMIGFRSQMGSIANQWASLPGDVAGASVAKIKEMGATAAIVMHYGGNDWSQAQINGLQTQFGAMGIEVIAVTDAGFKPEKQVSDLETIMAQSPDIIVSIPTDPTATAAALSSLPR